MRLPFVVFTIVVLGANPSHSDDDLTVFRAKPGETPPGKQLYLALERMARSHFEARRELVAEVKTPEDVTARQSFLRERFREALGEMPTEKTPLDARVVKVTRKDGYLVENVIYQSRPGMYVTANLYRPDAPGPFPGVLVPCGHSENGKAAETYQRISILLAKNGMVSLCFDPIGQGERAQLLDSAGKPAIKGSTTEHTLVGIGAMLVGRSAAGYRLWDAVRSLDYLASRTEVDPKRLGCTGNSGGGTETAYLMAFDDRVLAAAPSCYITSLERLFVTIGPQDAEQNLNAQVALGIEHADYIAMRAPKPTLLAVGTRDYFDIDGSWATFREAKRLYGRLGYGERVDLFESDETHGFTKARREACMRWMRRWLLDKNDSPVELECPIASDSELQCTNSGQVLSDFHGTSVFELTSRRVGELSALRERNFPSRSTNDLKPEIRKRLALTEGGGIIVSGPRVVRDGYNVRLEALTTEPGVSISARLFRPDDAVRIQPVIVYVGAEVSLGKPGEVIEARVKGGEWGLMIEPRGTGETTPIPPAGGGYGRGLFGLDEREAALAFHLGRPLLGQRVFDVLQTLRANVPNQEPREFHLIGVGTCGPVVLHAAALDDRVKSVEIENAIVSWSEVANTPVNRGQLSSVLPGILRSYDLPDLAASLAPRPLTIRDPIHADGKAMNQASAEEAYARVRAAYKAANASEKFKIEVNR